MQKFAFKDSIKSNNLWDIAFLVALAFLFFFFGFDKIILLDPQGIHFMRQTDSLSFTSQYYNNGFDFFNPQLYNLKDIDGKAACEFPLTYYLTALLYTVFGKHFFIQRIVHGAIIISGIIYTYKLSTLLLQDKFYALLISFFLFTSTVFNFYAFNYLPDAPALGFTLMGWYFIVRCHLKECTKSAIYGFLFFTLGSLIKITYLINPLAIIVSAVYHFLFRRNDASSKKEANKKTMIFGLASVSIVIIWNGYMLYYNSLYESTSFNTRALPIWSLSRESIIIVWDFIVNYWHTRFFAHSSLHMLFIAFLIQIIFYKKSNTWLTQLILILFMGNIAYFLLFYSQFRDHDYYFLAFFPLFALVLNNTFMSLQKLVANKYFHLALKLIFATIVVVGINYSRMKMEERFENSRNEFSKIGFLIRENLNEIKKIDIPDDAKFIIAPDLNQNGGLLFLDKMGWNIPYTKDISNKKIDFYKALGAEYLLLATNETTAMNTANSSGKMIFEGDGIKIFLLSSN